jgi:hypothetical protein
VYSAYNEEAYFCSAGDWSGGLACHLVIVRGVAARSCSTESAALKRITKQLLADHTVMGAWDSS